MIRTFKLWFFALCLSGSVSLYACLFSSQPNDPPGYLVIGIESNPTNLDPRYATDANSARITALIFNSLLYPDRSLRLQPQLAESWQAVDERTYVFTLRQGVTFHDGRPLTAADVKYTYESVLDPKNLSPKRGAFRFLESVEILGPFQVRFRLSAPYAPFLDAAPLGIVPAGTPTDRSAKDSLMGSGPFSLEEFVPGEKVILKANPAYWEGKPPVPGLVFKIIPDAMIRALEFKKAAIDFLQNDIEPDMLPWIRDHTNARILNSEGTTYQYIGFNLGHPILKNRDVRQAIAYAIDRDTIIRHLLKGLATPATGLLSPLHWAYDASVRQWPYDPEKAKRLLDQAGYRDPDGDGPLPRFKLSYKTTTLDIRRRMAEAFKDQLQQVGIELEIRTYEWGTFYADIKKGNFHLYSLAWVGARDPDIYFNLFHSSSIPPNGDNRGRYENPEIDHLLEQGRKAQDTKARRLIYARAQKILAQDLPYIPLWWAKNIVVMKPTIHGFLPYPDGDLISFKRVSFVAFSPAK